MPLNISTLRCQGHFSILKRVKISQNKFGSKQKSRTFALPFEIGVMLKGLSSSRYCRI